MGWIYLLRFPNGKCYVGQTVRKNLADRLRAHKNRAKSSKNNCRACAAAIRKYGWENVKHEVLMQGPLPNAELDAWERIAIFEQDTMSPNGYNLTPGGDVNPMRSKRVRKRLSKTCSTSEHKASTSKRIKSLHADPEWKQSWLESHLEAHQRPETIAKIVANNHQAWAKPGAREARGDAIRAALNTEEQIALRAERAEKSKATKAKNFQEKLAKLPPEERAAKEAMLERKRRERKARELRKANLPGSQ